MTARYAKRIEARGLGREVADGLEEWRMDADGKNEYRFYLSDREVSLAEFLEASARGYPAGPPLPHVPAWNLLPRARPASWECTWHGTVSGELCAECHREHAGYLEGGTWEDRRPVPSPEEVAAAGELTALTEELGLYGEGGAP